MRQGTPRTRRRWPAAAALVLAMGLGAPAAGQAAIGERLSAVKRHAFFANFHLQETARRPLLVGGRIVTFQTELYSRARDRVAVEVTLGPDEQVLELALLLRRDFVDGPERVYALDLARGFLREAVPEIDRAEVLPLVARFEAAAPPGRAAAPDEAADPAGPAAADQAWAVWRNRRAEVEQSLVATRLRIENADRVGGAWLILTVAQKPVRVTSAALAGAPPAVALPGGPVLAPLPGTPPPFAEPVLEKPPEWLGADGEIKDLGARRMAYLGLYLAAADVGGDKSLVRDLRLQGPTPADAAFWDHGGQWAGEALWLGTNRDPVWKLYDQRWVFDSPAGAAAWLATVGPELGAGLQRVDLPTAGTEGLVFRGRLEGRFFGIAPMQYLHVFRAGAVVVRLRAIEGPDARTALQPETMRLLAERAAGRAIAADPALLVLLPPATRSLPAGPATPPPPAPTAR